MIWVSSSGRIELELSREEVFTAHHSGDCEPGVREVMSHPDVATQLAQLAPESLVEVLRDYGAWDGVDLEDHAANLMRLVWIAAGDLAEETNLQENDNG
jgi:hypothetical protein